MVVANFSLICLNTLSISGSMEESRDLPLKESRDLARDESRDEAFPLKIINVL